MSTLIVRVWTHAGVKSCGACCCSSVFTNYPHHTRRPHCVTITGVTNWEKMSISESTRWLCHMSVKWPWILIFQLRSSLCVSPHTFSNFLFHHPTVSVTSQESAHLTLARGLRLSTRRRDPTISRRDWNSLKVHLQKKGICKWKKTIEEDPKSKLSLPFMYLVIELGDTALR